MREAAHQPKTRSADNMTTEAPTANKVMRRDRPVTFMTGAALVGEPFSICERRDRLYSSFHRT
jgi:hypothetical protein